MGKKLVSMLLVLAIGLALLPGMAVSTHAAETTVTDDDLAAMTTMSAWAEDGYSETVTELTITNDADFMAFQDAMCGSAAQTFDGITVYLTADLDLNEDWNSPVYLEWDEDDQLTSNAKQNYTTPSYYLPETTESQPNKIFNGVFDGLGHSISGLATQQGSINSKCAASLFGKTTGTATEVKNLVVLDSAFTNGKTTNLESKQTAVRPLAGLFTIIESGASATISNCYIDIDLYDAETVSSKALNSKVGGLVGYCIGNLTIENCVYAGSISNNKATASGDTATTAKKRMGGAVGLLAGTSSAMANATITNYVFTGTVYNIYNGASGGVGFCNSYANLTMTNCLSLGSLCSGVSTTEDADEEVAGAIACFNASSTDTIVLTDCYTQCFVKNGYTDKLAVKRNGNASFTMKVYYNGDAVYTYTQSNGLLAINPTQTRIYRSSKSGLYSFVKGENFALNEAPYGGVAEGETQKYLGDVFTIVGGVLAPKSLYENVLSNHIPSALTHKSHTISLEGNIWINKYAYFKDSDKDLAGFNLNANAGLLTWYSEPTDATYGTQDAKTAGLIWAPGKGAYGQSTEGIAAPLYGDKLYMREYVQVGDGYIYGDLTSFSVKDYCTSVIEGELAKAEADRDTDLMKLCAAVLNYGAAAQKKFDHDAENLVNAGIDSALTTAFDESMLKELDAVPTTAITDSGIVEKVTRSISLDEGIRINYYFKPTSEASIASGELLTWSNVDGELTYDNATVTDLTLMSDGRYAASGALVAAADCGDTIYACARFVDAEGNESYTAVTAYSAHQYAADVLALDSETYALTQEAVKALIVYSHLADAYFNA